MSKHIEQTWAFELKGGSINITARNYNDHMIDIPKGRLPMTTEEMRKLAGHLKQVADIIDYDKDFKK